MSDKQKTETRTSVGVNLRNPAEQKNLTIAEVANRLYLQPHVIEALEQDDHESLPSGTYVYGYLQNTQNYWTLRLTGLWRCIRKVLNFRRRRNPLRKFNLS